MTESQQLLADYRRTGSDTAFRELVTRYVDLVYSTALRLVGGDSHRAEDVTQTVFVDLSRKARTLPADVRLGGWLHRDTCLVAGHTLRGERRRHARERQAVEMNTLQNHPEADFSQVAPLLDEAINELADADRTAILLRFFEQQDFRAVGQALGSNEDAARMRVTRALEKLEEFLKRRGVTTSAASLGVVLTANAIQAAPVGLAAALSSAVCVKAATTAAVTSAVGILTLMTSAKNTTIVAALALVLFLGGAVVTFHLANSRGHQPPIPAEQDSATAGLSGTKNRILAKLGGQRRVTRNTETDPALAAALARLREVLYDPKRSRSRVVPDPAIQEAIAAFAGQRQAAVPLLREALQDASLEVRGRAAVALGLIGSDGKAAAGELLNLLRDRTAGSLSLKVTWALGQMGSMPEIVPDLIQVLKANPGLNVMMANCILKAAGADPQLVDQTMRHLLEDSNPQVREATAYVLGNVLKNLAGPEVVKIAIESLKSGDPNSQHLGLATLQDVGREPGDPVQPVSSANLGSLAAAAIAALIEVANHSKLEDRRIRALKMLDELDPDLRKQNPDLDAWLKNQGQEAAFTRRVLSGQATVPEMIEGLAQFPKATPAAATALARLGPEARAALPALQQAIVTLQPEASASESDRASAYDARATVANAMQKIAPDQPKLLFTKTDMRSLFDVLEGLQSDAARMQTIAAALQPVLVELPSRGKELTPEEMRLVLNTVKAADASTYDALVAQVKKIDPMFVAKPAP